MALVDWLILIIGVLALLGPTFDWDWYMESSKVQFVTQILGLGRTAARILYFCIGLIFTGYGVWRLVS